MSVSGVRARSLHLSVSRRGSRLDCTERQGALFGPGWHRGIECPNRWRQISPRRTRGAYFAPGGLWLSRGHCLDAMVKTSPATRPGSPLWRISSGRGKRIPVSRARRPLHSPQPDVRRPSLHQGLYSSSTRLNGGYTGSGRLRYTSTGQHTDTAVGTQHLCITGAFQNI